jgi:hypothetical protein
MKKQSFIAKAGTWVNKNLNLLELAAIFMLFIALLVFNYTPMQYNKLIIIPLVTIAIIYYLASFDYNINEGKSLLAMIVSKLVYLISSIGFLGISLEYLQNPGARIMILISAIASLVLLVILLSLKLFKNISFEAGVIIRSLIFNFIFTTIYLVAYGFII